MLEKRHTLLPRGLPEMTSLGRGLKWLIIVGGEVWSSQNGNVLRYPNKMTSVYGRSLITLNRNMDYLPMCYNAIFKLNS